MGLGRLQSSSYTALADPPAFVPNSDTARHFSQYPAEPESVPNEVIVEALGELGRLTLFGFKRGDCWEFRLEVADQSPLLLGESATRCTSLPMHSWAEAIELLDAYPWCDFSPHRIHPAFRTLIWAQVRRRAETCRVTSHCLDRWKDQCLVPKCP